MTMTTDERLDALITQLTAMGMPLAAEVAPMAAGDLPPHVAAGELITSAWGNAVVDELVRIRGVFPIGFNHGGSTTTAASGQFDCGQTTVGPFAYPVQVSVWAQFQTGFNGAGITASGGSVTPLGGAPAAVHPGSMVSASGNWAFYPLFHTYAVAAGIAAGFRTTANLTFNTTPNAFWYQCRGLYTVQRTGNP